MKPFCYPVIAFLGFWLLVACDTKFSSDRIRGVPELNNAHYERALSAMNESIEDHPDNADSYYKKAEILKEMEEYSSAMDAVKKAIQLGGAQARYQLLYARLLALDYQYEAAIEAALQASSPGMDRVQYHTVLSELYLKAGSKVEAFDHINKAIILAPQRDDLYARKGMIYLAYGDTVNAEKNILRSIRDSVENVTAYHLLTSIYLDKKQYAKAKQYVELNLEKAPANPEYLFQKARILNHTGQPDSAKNILVHLVAGDTAFYEGLNALGNIYYNAYKIDSANFYAEKALAVKWNYVPAMLLKARILDRTRNYWESVRKYNEIIAIAPTNTIAEGELRKLKRKIAYLQKMERQEKEVERQERTPVKPITPIESL